MKTYIITFKRPLLQFLQSGYTGLMVALNKGVSQETVEFLVAKGADINAEDEVPKHSIAFGL
jgi:hypothetical protein